MVGKLGIKQQKNRDIASENVSLNWVLENETNCEDGYGMGVVFLQSRLCTNYKVGFVKCM